jgi:hypothetical protein
VPLRQLSEIQRDVEDWIGESTQRFQQFDEAGKVWVLKYMYPQYLAEFLVQKQLVISATPGFTWGDGIYVSPLTNPYSTMMYGRVGVLGWLDGSVVRAYDAADRRGIELYQEWIQHSTFVFRRLTTTIHADRANRVLRNAFRRRFGIDVTFFRPDQYNRRYVAAASDLWFAVSDWGGVAGPAPTQRPRFSAKVNDCEWVAVVGEQFQETGSKTHFVDLIGPHLHQTGPRTLSNQALAQQLRQCHQSNASGAGQRQIAHVLA